MFGERGQESTVIEKYQSKTRQGQEGEVIMLTQSTRTLEEPKYISFVSVMLPCSPSL